ncbi:hypothetical protein RHMOL_Rhmol01G0094300 [Rhododendron molle]|uniref:Uncharacterized protein n=1 Tax=Rhododendron molle TaxID=49168 RepID=A0ACC0PZD6_RHOML|nr:hypothetical protein RHMOL_Rhmol01G0094300 [Rhododendron molle]
MKMLSITMGFEHIFDKQRWVFQQQQQRSKAQIKLHETHHKHILRVRISYLKD